MSSREFVNPYPGTAPFQDRDEDRLTFFGRDREITRLTDMILSEPNVLLFARSGLGKSSLINAGVLPKLRSSGCFPVVARVTHNHDGGPAASIFDRVESEATRHGLKYEGEPDRSSLWAYFNSVVYFNVGRRLKTVLVLDQFEELFTRFGPGVRTDFIDQFADLARGRVPKTVRADAIQRLDQLQDEEDLAEAGDEIVVASARVRSREAEKSMLLALAYGGTELDMKIVISMREDFLPELEALKDRIPLLFRNTMRLEPLTRGQAEEAIVKPTQQAQILGDKTVKIEPDAVLAMLDFLSGQQTDAQLSKTEDIEPVQLQILCHSLYERVQEQGRDVISVQTLGGKLGMSRILRGYYRNVVHKFPRVRLGWNGRRFRIASSNLYLVNLPRVAIQTLCEEGLILESGFRNSLEGGYIGTAFGVPEDDLAALVDQRLLRSEPRMNGRFYELAHDSLIGVLQTSRTQRRIFLGSVAAVAATAAFFGRDTIFRSWIDFQTLPLRRTIVGSGSDKERTEALIEYGRLSSTIDLSRQHLTGLKFDEQDLPRTVGAMRFVESFLEGCTFSLGQKGGGDLSEVLANFKRTGELYRYNFRSARIDGTHFDGSAIFLADFSFAWIENTTFLAVKMGFVFFQGARLADVDFSGAVLTDSLSGSSLSSVDFARAKFNRVNFSKADIRGVSFAGVALTEVNFSETEWWLAKGWSADQLEELERTFPHLDFAKSERYLTEIKARQLTVKSARDLKNSGAAGTNDSADADRLLARTLNDLAWYRAIHGTDLSDALTEVDEALTVLPVQPSSADTKTNAVDARAIVMDTKAYILMQQGQFAEAKQIFMQALSLDLSNPDAMSLSGKSADVAYRCAIVLEVMGDEAPAKKAYGFAAGQYDPTHERVLLKKPNRPKPQ